MNRHVKSLLVTILLLFNYVPYSRPSIFSGTGAEGALGSSFMPHGATLTASPGSAGLHGGGGYSRNGAGFIVVYLFSRLFGRRMPEPTPDPVPVVEEVPWVRGFADGPDAPTLFTGKLPEQTAAVNNGVVSAAAKTTATVTAKVTTQKATLVVTTQAAGSNATNLIVKGGMAPMQAAAKATPLLTKTTIVTTALNQGLKNKESVGFLARFVPVKKIAGKVLSGSRIVAEYGIKIAGNYATYASYAAPFIQGYMVYSYIRDLVALSEQLKTLAEQANNNLGPSDNEKLTNTPPGNNSSNQDDDNDPNKKLKQAAKVSGAKKAVEEYNKRKGKLTTTAPAKPAEKVQWVPHDYKHVPSSKMKWKDTVKATKHGYAKYNTYDLSDIERTERMVWSKGTPTTDGNTHKVMKLDKVIGAYEGKETQYIIVKATNNGNTIHGHPISMAEFLRVTKIRA